MEPQEINIRDYVESGNEEKALCLFSLGKEITRILREHKEIAEVHRR